MNKMFWTCFETESFRPKVSRPDDDRNGGERVQNPYNLSSVSLTENKEGEKGEKGQWSPLLDFKGYSTFYSQLSFCPTSRGWGRQVGRGVDSGSVRLHLAGGVVGGSVG